MTHFALLVTIRVQPDTVDAFRAMILEAAASAVRDEQHCQRFEVCQDEGDPALFVLFEVYTDSAALEHHQTTPHFKKFAEEGGPLILEKEARRLTLH